MVQCGTNAGGNVAYAGKTQKYLIDRTPPNGLPLEPNGTVLDPKKGRVILLYLLRTGANFVLLSP